MARLRNPVPTYLHHKQRGKARAVWTDAAGIRQYRMLPGAYGSPESRAAFARLQAELAAAPHQVVADSFEALSVSEVLLAYFEHAQRHYRYADGRPTSEIHQVKIVVKAVRELYGDRPVTEFGPLAVKAMRQKWIAEGRSRTECNRRVGMVKRLLKWGVSEELVPVTVYQAVATITGLQRGRTEARETEPIGPVEDAIVDATLPHLNRHVRGLVLFQRLTGCRPGEACSLRRLDIDTSGKVWLYKPAHHKTSHRGKSRTIAIGPQAQALLHQYFTANIDDFLFSPRRAMQESRGITKWSRSAKRTPRDRYDRTSYTRAIARACEQLHPLPGRLAKRTRESHSAWLKRLTESERVEVQAWREAHRWAPNQLRHSYATRARRLFSLEHAGAALGHTKMSATEIYAERDAGLAIEVAAMIG